MKQTVILGNFITVDDKRPFAEAALVKDGVFAYIGDAETAKKLADSSAQVLDYGANFIYPGFLESHTTATLPVIALSVRRIFRNFSRPITTNIAKSSRNSSPTIPTAKFIWRQVGRKTMSTSPKLILTKSARTSR